MATRSSSALEGEIVPGVQLEVEAQHPAGEAEVRQGGRHGVRAESLRGRREDLARPLAVLVLQFDEPEGVLQAL